MYKKAKALLAAITALILLVITSPLVMVGFATRLATASVAYGWDLLDRFIDELREAIDDARE